MKKNLLLGALAVGLLAACSQDEVTSINQEGIVYSVVTGKQTRAADAYCNNDLPGSFKVWARTTDDKQLYINGDEIKNTGGNPATWTDQAGTRYWPEAGLDFFAHVNGGTNFDYNNGEPKFNNFTVQDDVTKQLDLMYAVKLNQSKANGTVNLNFRHALSQICFRAQNQNAKLHVEISGVSVGHIGSSATFSYPMVNTDQNWEDADHNDIEHDITLPGQGTWTDAQSSALKQYDVTFDAVNVGATVTNLTCPGEGHVNGFAKVLTLLPQEVDAWDPSKPGTSATDWNGAYFLVKCKICNIAGDVYNAATDKVLHDNYAAIPVNIVWEQGKRYIYTFIFKDGGNGGYNPDPVDPTPVLTSIDYETTVDDFIPVEEGGNTPADNGDVDMNGDKTGSEVTKNELTLSIPAIDYTKTENVEGNEATFTIPATEPTKEDYEFKGWATAENATTATYQPGDEIIITKDDASITLYPVWEAKKYSFTINFDLNGGEAGEGYIAKVGVSRENGTVYPLGTKLATKEGYVFKGWGLTSDAKEVVTSVTLDKENPEITVYAVWEEVEKYTYTLSFDGTRTDVTGLPQALTATSENESYTFTVPEASNMACGERVFKGWAEKKDWETEADIKYQAGATITLTKDAPSKTLYAVWGTPTGVIVAPGAGGSDY